MFRPCKWAIVRLFVEPVSCLYNRSLGGTRSRLTSYLVGSPPQTPIVKSTYCFYEQPDDGPLTRTKHVVVLYYVVFLIT